MIRIFFLSVLCAGAAQNALAQATVDEIGEQLVNDFLTDVITMEGRFEQSLIDAEGVVGEVSNGTLYEQWLVADGMNIWSYDVDLAQVTVKPQAKALSNTPALLLGGTKDALEQFRFEGSRAEGDAIWVRMHPIDEGSGFNRVELGFLNGELYRMVFFDNLEQTTLVALYDLVINEPIDADRFDFIVPSDADLVGVPLAAGVAVP